MIRPMLKAWRPCGIPQPQKTSSIESGLDVRVSLEQPVDDVGAHLVRALLGQGALERAADRGPHGVDDHGFGHDVVSLRLDSRPRA